MSYGKIGALRQLLGAAAAAATLAILIIAMPATAGAEELSICIGTQGRIKAISSNGIVVSCPNRFTLLVWNNPGPTGPEGVTGPPGGVGPSGPTGPVGPVGVSGPPGLVGPTGPQGIPGPPGPVGSEGFNGQDGATGPTGNTGPTGFTGLTGATGVGGKGPSPTDNILFPGGDQLTVLTGGTLGVTVGSDDGPQTVQPVVANVDLGGTDPRTLTVDRAIAMGPGNGSERAICQNATPTAPNAALPCDTTQTVSPTAPLFLPSPPSSAPGVTATQAFPAAPTGDLAGIDVLTNNTTAVPMPVGCLEYLTVTSSNPPLPAVAGPGATSNYAFQVWKISFAGGVTTATAGNNFCVIPSGATSCSITTVADDFETGDLLLIRGVANGNSAVDENSALESSISWSASYQTGVCLIGPNQVSGQNCFTDGDCTDGGTCSTDNLPKGKTPCLPAPVL